MRTVTKNNEQEQNKFAKLKGSHS